MIARAILDNGSQQTYITTHLRDELSLPTLKLQIKTFGNSECSGTSYDVIQIDVETKNNTQTMDALVVPMICNPLTTQPFDHSSGKHDHLIGLKLADSADASDMLEVDVLIGSNYYWNLVTGRVIRGRMGRLPFT